MQWRAVVLCLSLAACSTPRTLAERPAESVVTESIKSVFRDSKLPGTPEASQLRAANPVSPGDWIVCLKSSDPERRERYALYFSSKLVASHLAAVVDRCDEDTYAPAAK